MVPDYVFRPMSAGDLSLVQRWLETPEVVRWWGRPDEQYALVSGDLDHPDMDQFIVVLGEQPFAYIQCYPLSTWNQGFGPQPSATRGIDQFIGVSDRARPWLRLHPAIRRRLAETGNSARRNRSRPGQCPRGARLCQGRFSQRTPGRYAGRSGADDDPRPVRSRPITSALVSRNIPT